MFSIFSVYRSSNVVFTASRNGFSIFCKNKRNQKCIRSGKTIFLRWFLPAENLSYNVRSFIIPWHRRRRKACLPPRPHRGRPPSGSLIIPIIMLDLEEIKNLANITFWYDRPWIALPATHTHKTAYHRHVPPLFGRISLSLFFPLSSESQSKWEQLEKDEKLSSWLTFSLEHQTRASSILISPPQQASSCMRQGGQKIVH